MIKILLIEDDNDYATFFCEYMEKKTINVTHINQLDIKKITQEVAKNPDLIILDFFFGTSNSLNVFSYLKNLEIPIVYLTSNDNSENEVNLLRQGVEDYIDKFKSLEIIETKIRKLVKSNNFECHFWGNTLNIETKKINGTCKLTENEYQIMMSLIKAIPNYISTEEIMIALWNDNIFIEKNTLVVAIKRLREKLRKNEINVVINSQKGKGYTLNEFS